MQPQRNVSAVRRFLAANGFKIVAEDLAEDDGFYYEIIAAEPGIMTLTDDEADFGPLLLAEGHALFRDFLILKEADMTQLLVSMAESNSPDSLRRKQQLEDEISRIGKLIGTL